MRSQGWSTIFLVIAAISIPAYASSPDNKAIDQETISALEARIPQAQPREQCFLYAELIHDMTEFSLKQYANGDVDKANSLLKEIQTLTHKMHLSVRDNDKRLKNAQILLRHTAFRLTEMLHSSSFEDRPLVQATLAQVNKAQDETMLEVFRK
jgi:cob(I)alamin adenosyltransferase